jgi:hypothetical protein
VTSKDVDDGVQIGHLLDQVTGLRSSCTADGVYDEDGAYAAVVERGSEAAVIVPPRSMAVLSDTSETAPTQRERHLRRMAWQNDSGYNTRATVEAAIGRWKQVIGDTLPLRTDERRVT